MRVGALGFRRDIDKWLYTGSLCVTLSHNDGFSFLRGGALWKQTCTLAGNQEKVAEKYCLENTAL